MTPTLYIYKHKAKPLENNMETYFQIFEGRERFLGQNVLNTIVK